MRVIIFSLIIFYISITASLSSKNKPESEFIGCNSEVGQKYLSNINKIKIKKIEIDTNNYRGWTVNSIRIITSPSRFISDRYKRRFNSKITVTYENDTKCIFEGRVRHSGDAKDHISLQGNTVIQSLDVHLDNGNIRGITKFKLFLPGTRGDPQDVIILTELLRRLNYLAPRSIKVNARVNQAETVMLFQEKASKELLEYNNRREGPILEADQKFFFKLVDKIPDNQLSNWSVQLPVLRSESIKTMLTKQLNSRIIAKSEIHKKISYEALTNLNLIYLYYSNRFKDEKNNFYYFDYDLDNTLLGFFNPKNIRKLDIYNLLMQATNSQHGLSASNRKFYWNSIESYFEPISYDLNPHFSYNSPTTTTATFRLPVSDQLLNAFEELEDKLGKLDMKDFLKKINLSGANETEEGLEEKIDEVYHHLKRLKNNYLSANKDLIEHNKFKKVDNIFLGFNKTLRKIDPDAYLVVNKKAEDNTNVLLRCRINFEDCEDFYFQNDNLSELLEGELILNKKVYQYFGKNLDFKNINLGKKYNKLETSEFAIFYESDIEIENKPNENILNITQNSPGSRVYILNGSLNNTTINFNGYELSKKTNKVDLEVFPPNYPIDYNGLTGCLSLINLNVKNISIKANNSSCEDTVNFINVKGSVENIDIKNSFSDGLDVDFSNLKIDNINILSSGNDCVDFSAGNYELGNLNLKNCGDKALSVGEKSKVSLKKIIAENSNMGVASKDSSIVTMKEVYLNNLETCVAAYNKKQEFNGGFINIQNMKCENFYKKADIDSYSKIFEKNIALKNYDVDN